MIHVTHQQQQNKINQKLLTQTKIKSTKFFIEKQNQHHQNKKQQKQQKQQEENNNKNKQIKINYYVKQLEEEILTYLNLDYMINDIKINDEEYLHTIMIKRKIMQKDKNKQNNHYKNNNMNNNQNYIENKQNKQNYIYLTHGFGGTSLMYFPILNALLQNEQSKQQSLSTTIILWEIRGMGLSDKLDKYTHHVNQNNEQYEKQLQYFFIYPIEIMLRYYHQNKNINNHNNTNTTNNNNKNTINPHLKLTFISHSFGAYLTFLYLLRSSFHFLPSYPTLILLSPIGLTPSHLDYKSKISSFSDIFHFIGNKISWYFNLTYKSPFRSILYCFKQKVFTSVVKNIKELQQQKQKQYMKEILLKMIQLKDGSQGLFFKYFMPRVLPKVAIGEIVGGKGIAQGNKQNKNNNNNKYKQQQYKQHNTNNIINGTHNNMQLPKQHHSQILLQSSIHLLYGGQQDWVDKTFAYTISQKYPQNIKIKIISECTHNLPFFPITLINQLKKIMM